MNTKTKYLGKMDARRAALVCRSELQLLLKAHPLQPTVAEILAEAQAIADELNPRLSPEEQYDVAARIAELKAGPKAATGTS